MSPNGDPDKASYIYNSQLDAFTLYHVVNETSSHSTAGPALPALGHATSGAAGTAIAKLVTYPLDLVITRLQVQRQLKRDGKHAHYTGILDAIETIYEREGGLSAFYSGVGPEVVKGVADSFLFFLAYSYVRQKRLTARGSGKSLPALEEIGVGVVAGAFSKFFTTPLQQIVTRKQTAAMVKDDSSNSPPMNAADIARSILHDKGMQGFWSGYSASLVLTLNPSITMLLHKLLLRLVVPRAKRNDPGARLTFLLAATSKALASTITYPFSLAKTRAQVSSQKPSAPEGETSEIRPSEKAPDSKTVRARQRTVFSTILRIAQTEGLLGLYQGLGAEVLKGFFSHGITMLMKERIHAVIISLYYTILHSMQKFPSPEELAKMASEEATDVYQHGKEQVTGAYSKGVELAGHATEKVREAVEDGSQRASALVEGAKQQASDAVNQTSQQSGDVLGVVEGATSDASQRAVAAAETGRDAAGNVGQRVSDAVKHADIKDIDGPDTGIKE